MSDRHGPLPPAATATSDAITSPPLPTPPELQGDAESWFRRLADALAGNLVSSDSPMLAQAATWLEQETRCKAALAGLEPSSLEYGRTMRAATSAAAAANQILAKFGLTPAARLKMPGPRTTLSETKAMTPTRPKTTMDLAADAWRAAGNTGKPSDEFIARFKATATKDKPKSSKPKSKQVE